MAGVNAIIFVLFAFLTASIPIIIGVYVCTDAKKRGMNAALWTLIAILAPAYVGFIIYLLVRNGSAQCPSCRQPVSEAFAVCPKCGAVLKDRCPSCGFQAEPDWKVCPQCAAELPPDGRVRRASGHRDKGLAAVLTAVILIMVSLFGIAAAAFVAYRADDGGTSFLSSRSDLLREDFADNPEVLAWLGACAEKPDGAYVLCFEGADEDSLTEYLCYIKGREVTGLGLYPQSGLFAKRSVNAAVTGRTDGAGLCLFFIETGGFSDRDLKLTFNGKKLNYELTGASNSIKPFTDREKEKTEMFPD